MPDMKSWMTNSYLKYIVLVGDQVSHNVAELGEGEKVGHLVVVRVPLVPGLDDELVCALCPGDQPTPAHLDGGESHLLHQGGVFEARVSSYPCTVAVCRGESSG